MKDLSNTALQSVRDTIEFASQNGYGARRTALILAGRVDGPNGRRKGGVLALHPRESAAVRKAIGELQAGDSSYFQRKLRNRNFDPLVRRAFKSKGGLSAKDADKVAGLYSDRLLFERGRRIARTESRQAVGAGAREGMLQVVDAGHLRREQVRKIWRATPDSRTRDTHAALNGTSVSLDEPFETATGKMLQHPGDMSLGAGGEDVINCRCWNEFRIDFFANEGGNG